MKDLVDIVNKNWKDWGYSYTLTKTLKELVDRRLFNPKKVNIYFMINELVRTFLPNGVYLEVGVHRGASIISAAYKNPNVRCIGVDHFKLHKRLDEDTEKSFLANVKKYNIKNIEYLKEEALDGIEKLFNKEPNIKVDLFYFDGTHEYEPQMDALNKIKSYIKDGGFICVDDLNINGVVDSVNDFADQNKEFKVIFMIVPDNRDYWWNGFAVLGKEG
jgi:tRNA G46 methylase TrmB